MGYEENFLLFWGEYPRRIAKITASKSYQRAIKNGATHEAIISGVRKYCAYVSGHEPEYIKHPSTWLNGGCWEDEYSTARPAVNRKTTSFDMLKNAARAASDILEAREDLWEEEIY